MYKSILQIYEELTTILYLHNFTKKLHDLSSPQAAQKQVSMMHRNLIKFDDLLRTVIV
jgi:hypothetical protein